MTREQECDYHEAIQGATPRNEQSYDVDVIKEDVSTSAESCTITLRATVLLSFWTVDNRWECLTADSKVEPDLFRDVKAKTWVVSVKDGNMQKAVVARPEHLRPLE